MLPNTALEEFNVEAWNLVTPFIDEVRKVDGTSTPCRVKTIFEIILCIQLSVSQTSLPVFYQWLFYKI